MVRPSAFAVFRLMTSSYLKPAPRVGQLARSLEDLIDVDSGAPRQIEVIRRVAHQPASQYVRPDLEHAR